MNDTELKEFEESVANFFKKEEIDSFSSGHVICPGCDFGTKEVDGYTVNYTDEEDCPECGENRETMDEPSLSTRECECCGSMLGGNRYPVSAYHKKSNSVVEFEVCEDCLMYSEYGTEGVSQ